MTNTMKILAAFCCALSLLGCDDDDGTSTPAPVLPEVTCCDYERRDDCHEYAARLVFAERPKVFPFRPRFCFEGDLCFVHCPRDAD